MCRGLNRLIQHCQQLWEAAAEHEHENCPSLRDAQRLHAATHGHRYMGAALLDLCTQSPPLTAEHKSHWCNSKGLLLLLYCYWLLRCPASYTPSSIQGWESPQGGKAIEQEQLEPDRTSKCPAYKLAC